MARFSVYYTEQRVVEAFLEADSLEEAQQKVTDIEDGELDFDDIVTDEKTRDGSYDFDIDTLKEVK